VVSQYSFLYVYYNVITVTTINVSDTTWDSWNHSIQTCLHNGLINDAFKIGLKEGDENLVLRLLNESVHDMHCLNKENMDEFFNKFYVTITSTNTRLSGLKWIERLTTSNSKLQKQMIDNLISLLGELVNKYGETQELLPEEIDLINKSADSLHKLNQNFVVEEQNFGDSNTNLDEYNFMSGTDSLENNKPANY